MERTDVALIVGANDVVNPDARTNENSPLYGMPIINADYAASTIVMKRTLNPGFAGTDNPLRTRGRSRSGGIQKRVRLLRGPGPRSCSQRE